MGIPRGFVLVSMLFLCITAQKPSSRDANRSGRRGDGMNTGNVRDKVVFNTDNTGRGSGGGSRGGSNGNADYSDLDCDLILRECQCLSPQPPPQPQRPTKPSPTVHQWEYYWDD
ncbi:uncharacterized protein LOC124368529 [Homalodisca vitripennis]|uniref:uncharacterized protein LOC124368529 n=1 Tax=Homalodisca vitripennis TaxID=197043 RepID=UPI001EEA57B2|nr:uncharacterized protein LOC124368529 [Homalodisca vitripennis]KAG8316819.1 hypothetical protein J6590_040066 [Homalodisca vitripennis]